MRIIALVALAIMLVVAVVFITTSVESQSYPAQSAQTSQGSTQNRQPNPQSVQQTDPSAPPTQQPVQANNPPDLNLSAQTVASWCQGTNCSNHVFQQITEGPRQIVHMLTGDPVTMVIPESGISVDSWQCPENVLGHVTSPTTITDLCEATFRKNT